MSDYSKFWLVIGAVILFYIGHFMGWQAHARFLEKELLKKQPILELRHES